jgi:hypothetical protein
VSEVAVVLGILSAYVVLVPVTKALSGALWTHAAAHVAVYAVCALVAYAIVAALGASSWFVLVSVLIADPLARKLVPLPRPAVLGGTRDDR